MPEKRPGKTIFDRAPGLRSIGIPDGPAQKSPRENKERLGNRLQIARLLSPQQVTHTIAKIVGIPFEQEQLSSFQIVVQNEHIPLLHMMGELDLLGTTQGVPHLSVGGITTQMGRNVVGWEQRTTNLESNASRSYLVADGIGVQGMGLVQYKEGQIGFGLDELFNRNTGDQDIGGGIMMQYAKPAEKEGNRLWLFSLLQSGHPHFARVFALLTYQTYQFATRTGIIIREDGKREVARKELVKAIIERLPELTDFFLLPNASFESDGHNAFRRDGEIIFTDYEGVDSFENRYSDFMAKLGDRWYFEELRKRYDQFLSLYHLQQTGTVDYHNIDAIYPHVDQAFDGVFMRKDIMDKINHALAVGDPKAIVRYAMAGVIGSHAIAREVGRFYLRQMIHNELEQNYDTSFTLQQMQHMLEERMHYLDEEPSMQQTENCSIVPSQSNKLTFDMRIRTFGLPIEASVTVPVTLADIYDAWPYDAPVGSIKKQLILEEIRDNPFQVDETLFSNTLYAHLANALSNIKSLDIKAIRAASEDRLQGYDKTALEEGKIVFRTDLPHDFPHTTFHYGNQLTISVDEKHNALKIEAPHGVSALTTAQLNKIAYVIHTTALYFSGTDTLAAQTVAILDS